MDLRTRLLGPAIAGILLSLPGSAAASNWWLTCGSQKLKWPGGVLVFRYSKADFPGGFETGLLDAVNAWNGASSAVTLFLYGASSISNADMNGVNDVFWANGINAPARTFAWTSGCQILETDVVVSPTSPWTPHPFTWLYIPYGGTQRALQPTLIHEFGHAIGLAHTADRYSVMGADYSFMNANGGVARFGPGEDAVSGVRSVYGDKVGALEDVSVSHWRRTGESGGYSQHSRTRVLGSNYAELPKSLVGQELVYLVKAGTTVLLEMTYENNGKNSLQCMRGFYLSANGFVSTSDTLVAYDSTYLGNEGYPLTLWKPLVIPSSLSVGSSHWLGAIVDPFNWIGETNETDNASYIQIQIVP